MMRIRAVERRDVETWVGMRRSLWPGEDADELAVEAWRFVESGTAPGLAAVLISEATDGTPTGFIEIGLRDYVDGCRGSPVPYVEGWFVEEALRRSGVGRALIRAAEAWALERGYSELGSDALLDNVVSERAHKALGFAEVERAIRFRKDLRKS